MGNPPLIVGLLINGVAYAAIFIVAAVLLSRFTSEVVWRSFLVLFLFIAAGVYIVFAVRAGEGILWVLGELAGVAIFGGMALLGLRGSIWWIVAGWALHPLWDVGLHYLGPGRPFAPATYTIACLSFDLLVATYVAIAYGLGLPGGRSTVLRER
jgi:uncharacterized protein DUF6010